MNEHIRNNSDGGFSLEREYVSSSSSVFQNLEQGKGVLEDKGYFNGETLSLGFERIYGFKITDKITASEISLLTRNVKIFDLISEQKVYHFNGLAETFEVPKTSLRRVQNVLIKRDLLKPIKWKGKAKRSFGMILLVTRDCVAEDIEDYMKHTVMVDELRLDFQQKNKKKTPQEVVDHNKEVSRLTAEFTVKGNIADGKLEVVLCMHDQPLDNCNKLICISRREKSELGK